MNRLLSRWLVIVALAAGAIIYVLVDRPVSVVQAVPVPPATFFGLVTVGGSPAQSGLAIEARINGTNFAFSSVESGGVP